MDQNYVIALEILVVMEEGVGGCGEEDVGMFGAAGVVLVQVVGLEGVRVAE